jgi:hypothetical protein
MCDSMPLGAVWMVLGPRLECLYTQFLLHKLLISLNEGKRDEMIQTSHEILHLVLSLLKKLGVHTAHLYDLEWMVSYKDKIH